MASRKFWVGAGATFCLVSFYFMTFGAIFYSSPDANGLEGFVIEIVKVLMGAGVIAILTSVIFVFQTSIEEKNAKRQEVFKEKLNFYKNVLAKIEDIERDDVVSSAELKDFQFLIYRSALISNPSFSKALTAYYDILDVSVPEDEEDDDKGATRQEAMMNLLQVGRDDLDVQNVMTASEKLIFADFLSKITARSEALNKSQTNARKFRTKDEKRKIVIEYTNHGSGKVKWLMNEHGLHPAQIVTWKNQFETEDEATRQ